MKNKRIWPIGTCVAVLCLGGWQGYRVMSQHSIAGRAIPPAPTLTGQPAVLVESISLAEARARGWGSAKDGLADLGQLYHANGFYPEAMQCYEGLVDMEPNNAHWLHLQASIVASFGRMDEALPLRQRVVELEPHYTPGRLRLGDVLLKTNRIGEAAEVYSDVLRRVPADPYALLGLARCSLAGEDWAKAKEHLEKAVAQHPDFIGALSLLVTVNEHLGDQVAAQSYKNAMSGGVFTDLPDPWVDQLSEVCYDPYLLSVTASVANFAGDRPQALELINRAISLSPEAISYRRQAGQYYLQEQNFGAAKTQMEKALAINPADSDCWLRYLEALRGLGQTQAVAKAILTGLSHCPDSSALHLEYARWLKSVNRLDEAIAQFRQGYELRPSEASPLVELGTTLLSAGRTDEAVASLNQALERQPDHPSALATLTYIAISNKDEAEARRRFEQVRRQTKVTPEIVRGLAQSFQQQFGKAP